ncbi:MULTISPECIES: hypothetical protein [unclassified Pseudoalteromonas]|uniref:hypothetical protein n=1 Tax=unclassified Pseudoalteromonas TaxID=194690 RepID=UPI002097D1BA|nr:hypothetical protein [Pseudoalteromonas sp. XMcav2-N]MCO7187402.1 hypothetical protein [Pseudoalteromonas sp. XMcav2-N]
MKLLFFSSLILLFFMAQCVDFDTLSEGKKTKFDFDKYLIIEAAELYEKENGKAVESINDLVPRYLKKIPECPYQGVYEVVVNVSVVDEHKAQTLSVVCLFSRVSVYE